MRFLLRLLLFWAISLPLFYGFGMPYLLEKVTTKARADGYSQCLGGLRKTLMMDAPSAPLTRAQGDAYCHCLSDSLTFTRDDLMDKLQKKPMAHLEGQAQSLSTQCAESLKHPALAPAPKPSAPQPWEDNQGTIHF